MSLESPGHKEHDSASLCRFPEKKKRIRNSPRELSFGMKVLKMDIESGVGPDTGFKKEIEKERSACQNKNEI